MSSSPAPSISSKPSSLRYCKIQMRIHFLPLPPEFPKHYSYSISGLREHFHSQSEQFIGWCLIQLLHGPRRNALQAHSQL